MEGTENIFPMDVTDATSRPSAFRPEGYLVAILAGPAEADAATEALVEHGFAAEDLKRYSGEEILANHDEYLARRTVGSKVAGSILDDTEGRELYLGYARAGRSSLWLRMPDPDGVAKALRVLADQGYLHARYYDPATGWTDYHVG